MSIMLQSDVCSGGTILWMLMRWRPGVVDWGGDVFASCCRGSNCSLARAMDGRISAAAPLALANQLLLPMIVKHGWSGFPVRRAIEESLAIAFSFEIKWHKDRVVWILLQALSFQFTTWTSVTKVSSFRSWRCSVLGLNATSGQIVGNLFHYRRGTTIPL